MQRKFVFAAMLACAAAIAAPDEASAQRSMGGMGGMDHGAMMGQPSGATAVGEVRKVDKEAAKLTLKHGPIPSADMPAMTMVYRVRDVAMLEGLKAGDKVKFAMDKIDGNLTVTRIEPAK